MKTKNVLIALSIIALSGGIINAAPETPEVKAPEALKIVEPEVPYSQTRWGATGTVVVTFEINENGETANIHIESADDTVYAAKVEEAVRQWRFKAPEVQGVTYRQVVNFS
ncbi:MAG: energy transducer TonB [Puniceicoccaceae bacterium]